MTDTKNPRLVAAGDKIFPKGRKTAEAVRSVAVIVRLADGTDHVYETDEEVRVAPLEELVPSEIELQEAIQREAESEARQKVWEEAQREQAKKEAEQRAREELEEIERANASSSEAGAQDGGE